MDVSTCQTLRHFNSIPPSNHHSQRMLHIPPQPRSNNTVQLDRRQDSRRLRRLDAVAGVLVGTAFLVLEADNSLLEVAGILVEAVVGRIHTVVEVVHSCRHTVGRRRVAAAGSSWLCWVEMRVLYKRKRVTTVSTCGR